MRLCESASTRTGTRKGCSSTGGAPAGTGSSSTESGSSSSESGAFWASGGRETPEETAGRKGVTEGTSRAFSLSKDSVLGSGGGSVLASGGRKSPDLGRRESPGETGYGRGSSSRS